MKVWWIRTCWVVLAAILETVALGDRHPALNIIYPSDVFFHNGGRVIDITKPPFNAKGDGTTDNTAAFVAAMDTIANRLRLYTWTDTNSHSLSIYVPNGTYLVSNTLCYNGPKITYQGYQWGGMIRLRVIGQNRDSTIIRLKESSAGFEAGSVKSVLAFQKEGVPEGNNIPGSNQLRNITVKIGANNPGAVGVVFIGANKCDLNNVSIISEDKKGYAGLDIPLISTQGHLLDITIDGFDYGIRVKPYGETNPSFEHVTLKNQNTLGVWISESNPVIRSVVYDSKAPFCKLIKKASSVVLVDAQLDGRGVLLPALHLADTNAQIFARNVTVKGFTSAIKRSNDSLVTERVEEYVSGKVYRLSEKAAKISLNLPVEDAPPVYWEQDLNQWANVDLYPGADTKARIQNALNSGKSTIYFPGLYYKFSGTVTIPATVRRLEFLFSSFSSGAKFKIAQESPYPLHFENRDGRGELEQALPRVTVVRNASVSFFVTHNMKSKAFLEACVNTGASDNFCPANMTIYARSINDENKGTSNFKVNGGILWVLGFKSEGPQISFEVKNGGTCEVLGGYRNETMSDSGYPMVLNDNSNVSFVGFTSMARLYKEAIWEKRGLELYKTTNDMFPKRSSDYFVPLYVGYRDVTTVSGKSAPEKVYAKSNNGAVRIFNIQGQQLGNFYDNNSGEVKPTVSSHGVLIKLGADGKARSILMSRR